MKKILIISYYFPPSKAIAANRPQSFADNFMDFGLFPIVLTRHWEGTENVWEDFHQSSENLELVVEENERYSLIKTGYQGQLYKLTQNLKNSVVRKLFYIYTTLKGTFHIEVNAYECFKESAQDILEKEQIDAVLVSSPPLNIIKLGAELSEQFGKPLIVDFRDLWNNPRLSENYKPTVKVRFFDFIHRFYLRKWLKKASLIISVSQPLIDEIDLLGHKSKTLVVTNGFEENLFEKVEPVKSGKFNFSVIGTLYPQQDLSILIDGLNIFLKDKNSDEIEINFIGTAAIPEIKSLLENNLPGEFINVTNKIPRAEAIGKLISADVLFYAGWRGFKGMASGKIFEYLGSGRNILIAPGDDDIIDKLVTETNAGKIANSVSQLVQILNDWFAEWKTNGSLSYKGIPEKVKFYSRENQARFLATEINSLIIHNK